MELTLLLDSSLHTAILVRLNLFDPYKNGIESDPAQDSPNILVQNKYFNFFKYCSLELLPRFRESYYFSFVNSVKTITFSQIFFLFFM